MGWQEGQEEWVAAWYLSSGVKPQQYQFLKKFQIKGALFVFFFWVAGWHRFSQTEWRPNKYIKLHLQLQQTFLTIILKLSLWYYGVVWEHNRFTLTRQKWANTPQCQLETELPLVWLVWISTAPALIPSVHTLAAAPTSVRWTLGVKTKLLPLSEKFQHITGSHFQGLHTPYSPALCFCILLWCKHIFSLKPKFGGRGFTSRKALQVQQHTNCTCVSHHH